MSWFANFFKEHGCPYWEEYPQQFRGVEFTGRVVAIIGGDCGSSCVWALLMGARECIMYEADQKLRDLAKQVVAYFGFSDKVKIRGEWRGDEYPDSDVLLMDCEGCEEKADIDVMVKKYSDIGIAVHEWTPNRLELLKKLAYYRFKLTYVTPDGKELYFVYSV